MHCYVALCVVVTTYNTAHAVL